MLAAFRRGEVLTGGAVDARLLRECCVAGAHRVDPRGLRLRGVHVRGRIDLAGVDVGFPLVFEDCVFDEAPSLEGGSVRSLAITGSPRLPGLLANGLRVRGDLDLSRSRIAGAHATAGSTTRAAVWLCDADVGRRLLCAGTVVEPGALADPADPASPADRGVYAVRADRIRIGASLFLVPDPRTGRGPRITGPLSLGGATVGGRVILRGAVLCTTGPGPALMATRLAVGGWLTLTGGCRVTGGLDFSHGSFTAVTVERGCTLAAPASMALDLTGAQVRADLTIEPGVTVEGTVRVADARIHGNLTMREVVLGSPPPEGALLSAVGVVVDGAVNLQRLRATGGWLGFRGARIGGALDAAGAVLHNPAERTLGLLQAVVSSSVRLTDGFHSTGFVVLNRCVIEGRLNLRDGRFECPGPSEANPSGHAIQAIGATVRAGLMLRWAHVAPSVDLRGLATPVLDDDPERWPERFVISGMTYERFGHPAFDRAARLRWLRRQHTYDSGPYEQLARVFRQHGHTADAEMILIERRHQARRAARHPLNPYAVVDVLLGWLVGYGYRPGRTVWLLLALLAAVAVSLNAPGVQETLRATDPRGNTYAVDGRLVDVAPPDAAAAATDAARSSQHPRADACGDGQVRCFNAALYAVDTVLPLISLGQRTTWYPSPHTRHGRLAEWWLNLATLAGWLLSTVFVLSFTRFARSA